MTRFPPTLRYGEVAAVTFEEVIYALASSSAKTSPADLEQALVATGHKDVDVGLAVSQIRRTEGHWCEENRGSGTTRWFPSRHCRLEKQLAAGTRWSATDRF